MLLHRARFLMVKVSATIVTLNEERKIARTIESLRCCDEVLVLDSGSTDRTCPIARSLYARVMEEPWRGYAAQKNRAAECAEHDWILSLDADETLSEELEAEILELKQNGLVHSGYSMPRMAQYLGRWIRHSGWYPDRKIRLYDRRQGEWRGDYVHESVVIHGVAGALHGAIHHFTCDSLSEHLRTLDRYTNLASEELKSRGKKPGMARLVIDPAWTFFRSYVLKRGFLDGFPGLAIAHMAALYTFLKYAKARQ